mmetsp:Transcript_11979/g.24951  ORF Transcript_11979/g.24951 Transcript_11979/m.24951 type:complete len:299 (-) Transcript_11979:602-1498(-)
MQWKKCCLSPPLFLSFTLRTGDDPIQVEARRVFNDGVNLPPMIFQQLRPLTQRPLLTTKHGHEHVNLLLHLAEWSRDARARHNRIDNKKLSMVRQRPMKRFENPAAGVRRPIVQNVTQECHVAVWRYGGGIEHVPPDKVDIAPVRQRRRHVNDARKVQAVRLNVRILLRHGRHDLAISTPDVDHPLPLELGPVIPLNHPVHSGRRIGRHELLEWHHRLGMGLVILEDGRSVGGRERRDRGSSVGGPGKLRPGAPKRALERVLHGARHGRLPGYVRLQQRTSGAQRIGKLLRVAVPPPI